METKLDCAIKASKKLITNLHREGVDRGHIATFNDFLSIRQDFTSNEKALHRSLESLRNAAKGETRLYDSIIDVASKSFAYKGDPSRPWIMIVVTDGDDNSSSRGARQCGEDVYETFTQSSSNFLFVVGVGDRVNTKKMEEMSKFGKFSYIPVKDFPLLELIFLTLAHEVTNSLSLSIANLSIGSASVSWAEVQQKRELSNVAIDYSLLIDISASMGDRAVRQQPPPAQVSSRAPAPAPARTLFAASTVRSVQYVAPSPPPPRCFAGHELRSAFHINGWTCDICGSETTTGMSAYNCRYCNFDACPSHCEPGRPCKPLSHCRRNHPLKYIIASNPWRCDEDQQLYVGGRLRCNQCDYDMCTKCLNAEKELNAATLLFAGLLLQQ